VSVVLWCRRADGSHREVGVDRAEVSRGRSTGGGTDISREGPNAGWGGGVGAARAGRSNRRHPAHAGLLPGGDVEVPLSTAVERSGRSAHSGEAVLPGLEVSLWERLLSRENLGRALGRVRANRGAPGVDGMTTEELVPWLAGHWAGVMVDNPGQHRDRNSCPCDETARTTARRSWQHLHRAAITPEPLKSLSVLPSVGDGQDAHQRDRRADEPVDHDPLISKSKCARFHPSDSA
jgi:hypothetical protein